MKPCPACGIDPSLLLVAHAIVRVRADREQNPDLDRLAHQLKAAIPDISAKRKATAA